MKRRLSLAIAMMLALVAPAMAQGKDPAVPVGRMAGGVPVVVLSVGVYYTPPGIAGRVGGGGGGDRARSPGVATGPSLRSGRLDASATPARSSRRR